VAIRDAATVLFRAVRGSHTGATSDPGAAVLDT